MAGSGAHGDLNAHLIDLARFLVGEFVEVVGHTQTFVTERPIQAGGAGLSQKGSATKGKVTVDDTALFLAEFEGGEVGSFEATRFALGRKNYSRIEINNVKPLCPSFLKLFRNADRIMGIFSFLIIVSLKQADTSALFQIYGRYDYH